MVTMRLITVMAIITLMPVYTSYAENISDDISALCSELPKQQQSQCLEKQHASFEAVKDHMNAIITSGGEDLNDGLTHYLPDLMQCIETHTLRNDLIDYVSAHTCMKNFSLARSY